MYVVKVDMFWILEYFNILNLLAMQWISVALAIQFTLCTFGGTP